MTRIDLAADGASGEVRHGAYTGLACDHTGFAFAPDDSYALCANTGRGTIARLDLRSSHVNANAYTGFKRAKGVAIAPSGKRVTTAALSPPPRCRLAAATPPPLKRLRPLPPPGVGR